MKNLIQAKNYKFKYPNSDKYALNIEEFSLKESSFSLLFGKSACGKTTFLRQLSDNLMLRGKEEGILNATKEVAYVWQNPDSQIVTDRVEYEIAFGLENKGFSKYLMDRRIAEVADFFGLEDIINQNTMDLSGGQKQILNLAAAVALKPKLLLLDEPTSQLDPISAMKFFQLLKKINEDLGITILLVEQRLEEIFSMVDSIVYMDKGEIIFHENIENISAIINNKDWHTYDNFFPAYVRLLKKEKSDIYAINKSQARKWILENYTSSSEDKNKIEDLEEENDNYIEKIITDGKKISSNLEIRDLFFRYKNEQKDVINDCNFSFPKNAITCIVGPNGGGKSTLLSLLFRYLSQNKKKKKEFQGKIIPPLNSKVSYLPQECKDLFIEETIKKNIYLGRSEKEIKIALEILEKLDFTADFDKSPFDLSGGEIQRLALAMVLSKDVDVFLLDEPTKGMDNYSKKALGKILNSDLFEGKMQIIISHDMEFAAQYADFLTIMFNGSLNHLSKREEFFVNNYFYNTSINKVAREIDMRIVNLEDFEKYAKKIN